MYKDSEVSVCKEKTLSSTLDDVTNIVDTLSMEVERLEGKLYPVLKPCGPVPAPNPNNEHVPPIAPATGKLEEELHRMRRIYNSLRDIYDRINL